MSSRLHWALADGLVVAGRDVAHWRRSPVPLLVTLLFPVLVMGMFLYLLGGGMTVPGGASYRDFLLPGMLTLAMAFGLETTMGSVALDAQRGITDRFRAMPMAPSGVVLGRCLADLGASALGLAVLLASGLALGWRPAGPGPLVTAVGLLLLLRCAFLWMGIWMGLLARDPGAVAAVQILVWPVSFLSNAFVAPSTMPGWLAALAQWNPLSATVTAVRRLMEVPVDGTGWAQEHSFVLALGWPIGLTTLFAVLAVRRWRTPSR
jgi:ABC transporter DrrB family efflux protein